MYYLINIQYLIFHIFSCESEANAVVEASGDFQTTGPTQVSISSSELSVDVTIPGGTDDFPENSQIFVDIVQINGYESVGLISTEAVDINVFTPGGDPITRFAQPVEICLSVPENVDRNDACLSFLNENNEWECQDECLDSKTNERGEKALCGETDHFTTFALLFSIDGEDCNNDNQDLNATLGWLTLALVILAICIVMIAVGGIEIVYRKQRWQLNKQLKAAGISKLMQQKAGTSLWSNKPPKKIIVQSFVWLAGCNLFILHVIH